MLLFLTLSAVWARDSAAASPTHQETLTELRGASLGYSLYLPEGGLEPAPVLMIPAHPRWSPAQELSLPVSNPDWAVLVVDGWNVFYPSMGRRAYRRLSRKPKVKGAIQAAQQVALRHALAHYDLDPERVICHGISASGNACWELGIAWPDVFAGIWALSSGFHRPAAPEDWSRLSGQKLYLVHGSEDPLLPQAWVELAAQQARSAGAEVCYRLVEGAGHGRFEEEVWAAGLSWAEQQRIGAPGEGSCGAESPEAED